MKSPYCDDELIFVGSKIPMWLNHEGCNNIRSNLGLYGGRVGVTKALVSASHARKISAIDYDLADMKVLMLSQLDEIFTSIHS